MRKERNTGLYLRGKAVAGLARIPAPDVRRCPFPVPRRACLPYLMGKAPRPSALSRDASKIRRANSEALLPRRGEQRRSRTLAASLAPAGQGSVAQRMPLQAAGSCSWACRRLFPLPPHPNRNAARPPPARGAGARLHGAEGTGSRHCRRGLVGGAPRHESPPGFFYSICPFPPLAALSSSRPAKQSAHRGRTAPSAVYYPRRPQKQPARVGTRTVKECRNRFQPLHFWTTISGRRHWLPWPGQQR